MRDLMTAVKTAVESHPDFAESLRLAYAAEKAEEEADYRRKRKEEEISREEKFNLLKQAIL